MAGLPRISVLTTTYNGERYLPATIESILHQTWTDFEYILVDDCSTDNTFQMLQEYAAKDARIRVVQTDARLGPAGAANLGRQHAQGEYIANLDHDDLAMPGRLEKQLDFLQRSPSVGMVGANIALIDENGDPILDQRGAPAQVKYITSPVCIRWLLQFGAPVCHSAMLIRRDLLSQVGGYSSRYAYVCDYELAIRVARVTEITNLRECLGACRHHHRQTSVLYRTEQNGMVVLLIAHVLRHRLRELVALEDAWAFYQCQPGAGSDSPVLVADPTLPSRALPLVERVYTRFIEDETPGADELEWIHRDYVRRVEYLNALIAKN